MKSFRTGKPEPSYYIKQRSSWSFRRLLRLINRITKAFFFLMKDLERRLGDISRSYTESHETRALFLTYFPTRFCAVEWDPIAALINLSNLSLLFYFSAD